MKIIDNETNDYELLMLYNEKDELAKNLLYEKYSYIIPLVINKYKRNYIKLKIDEQEVYSEANVGFSDALTNYRDDKNASLPTFITLCIERRLFSLARKYMTQKHKLNMDTLSLETAYNDSEKPLLEMVSDNGKNDPLNNLEENDNFLELKRKIEKSLSKSEYEVYSLMINNYDYKEIAKILNVNEKYVDNAIQRIKNKVKNIINA